MEFHPQASTSKGLDSILQQLEKRKKLSILDKSRKVMVHAVQDAVPAGLGMVKMRGYQSIHLSLLAYFNCNNCGLIFRCIITYFLPRPYCCMQDWGEFKDEAGVTEELEEYKKSGDRYTERVDFLQRADVREYERERDAKLAAAGNRKRPMIED